MCGIHCFPWTCLNYDWSFCMNGLILSCWSLFYWIRAVIRSGTFGEVACWGSFRKAVVGNTLRPISLDNILRHELFFAIKSFTPTYIMAPVWSFSMKIDMLHFHRSFLKEKSLVVLTNQRNFTRITNSCPGNYIKLDDLKLVLLGDTTRCQFSNVNYRGGWNWKPGLSPICVTSCKSHLTFNRVVGQYKCQVRSWPPTRP